MKLADQTPNASAMTALEALAERFWSKVDKNGPKQPHMKTRCWMWTDTLLDSGYGRLMVLGKHRRAHRLSYLLLHKEIPDDQCVLHECDNPSCVRPTHLHLGTSIDNNRERDNRDRTAHGDLVPRERRARGESQGSAKLTARDVLEIRFLSDKRLSHRRIAQKYDVSPSTVRKVLAGATWRHV